MTDAEARRLVNAAGRLLTRQENGETGLLGRAARLARAAITLSDDADVLDLAAKVLHHLASETGAREDHEAAEHVARRAIAAAEPDHPVLAVALGRLALIRHERFREDGDHAALREACSLADRSVTTPAEDEADHASLVANQLAFWSDREDVGEHRLSQLLHASQAILDSRPGDDPEIGELITNHGLVLRRRAALLDSPDDRHAAIGFLRRSADLQVNDMALWARRRTNLGDALAWNYERTGTFEDLDSAVAALRRAAGANPDPRIARQWGAVLHQRYERFQVERDLDEALNVLRSALARDPARSPDLLLDLAHVLRDVGRLRGDTGASVEALALAREAVRRSRGGQARRAANTVAILLNADDISAAEAGEAVHAARQALDPSNGRSVAPDRSVLGTALLNKGELTRDVRLIDQAIAEYERAVSGTAADDPFHAKFLANLGTALYARYEIGGRRADRRRALEKCRLVATAKVAEPSVRQAGARNQGYLALKVRRHDEAAAALELAVRLQAEVVPERLDRADIQRLLSESKDLTSDAAALACARLDHMKAVQLLELGRGVMLGRALRLRSDPNAVRRLAPELADEYEEVRGRLDNAARSSPEERVTTARDYHDVLRRIRAVDGLRGFLRPPGIARLAAGSTGRPVVLINVSDVQCDALVLINGKLGVIPLPDLEPDDVGDHVRAVYSEHVTEHDRRLLLDWLWRAVVRPVLDPLSRFLGRTKRVWWVPTGALGLLPLHAATGLSGESALDRVVSSYAPTVSAIHHARRSRADAGPVRRRVVLSAEYDRDPLPASIREAARVADLWSTPRTDVTALTPEQVLAAFVDASSVHVALHAVTDASDPSASGLELPTGRLTVADIANARLADAELCYLSACATTATTTELVNEAIHPTSAFFLSGFRNVVGTFWPLPDAIARRAARLFHSRSDAHGIPRAVHDTNTDLRRRFPDHPSLWTSLHHVGG